MLLKKYANDRSKIKKLMQPSIIPITNQREVFLGSNRNILISAEINFNINLRPHF